MKTTTEKELERASKKFCEWAKKARNAAENYIREVLVQQPDKRIVFDTEYDDECIYIIYDGGNHPEYASNVSSEVFSVYRKDDGTICLSTEDSDEYDIRRVEVLDLLTICDAIQLSWLPRQKSQ